VKRRERWALGALAVVVAAGAAAAISAMVAEPDRSTTDQVAVGNKDGQLVILACVADGIGEAIVALGSRATGVPVWSVRLSSGPPLKIAPLEPQLSGYEVTGPGVAVDASGEFNLHGLTDAVGRPLLVTVLRFTPSKIGPGLVKTAHGDQHRLTSTGGLESERGCVRPRHAHRGRPLSPRKRGDHRVP
jgi:hypothetical protein